MNRKLTATSVSSVSLAARTSSGSPPSASGDPARSSGAPRRVGAQGSQVVRGAAMEALESSFS